MAIVLDRDPGETSFNAFDIGILDGSLNYIDSIGEDDRIDLYKFSLAQTSQITSLIEANNKYGISIDFFVDRDNDSDVDAGESILRYGNYASLGYDAEIITTLGAGDYTIRLESYFFNDYSLDINAIATPASVEIDPGNTFPLSFNFGHINDSNNIQITEFIGIVDPTDIYRFSIDESQLTLNIQNITGKNQGGTFDIDLIEDNNNNGEIDSNDILFSDAIEFLDYADNNYLINFDNQTFNSGNYFLRFNVSDFDQYTNTNYTFELSSSLETDINSEDTNIYRFFRSDIGSHFYTASLAERDYVSKYLPQYQYEGASYQAIDDENATFTGAKPVYRFFNNSTGVHLYTMSEVEKDHIIDNLDNYSFENIAYYAYENPKEKTIPLYRFYHTIADTHFFTPSTIERDYINGNLSWYQEEGNEGIAFYVEPFN